MSARVGRLHAATCDFCAGWAAFLDMSRHALGPQGSRAAGCGAAGAISNQQKLLRVLLVHDQDVPERPYRGRARGRSPPGR